MAARDRKFFTGISLAFAVVVFAGFAPTYFLRGWSSEPALPLLVHVHGALFTGWILLLIAQSGLVATKRVDLHRALGLAGVGLAIAMVIAAYRVAIAAGRRDAHVPGELAFLLVPLGALVVFPVLAGAAFWLRRRADFHKRLIVIATIELMNAAVDRLPGVAAAGLRPFYVGTDLFLLALVIYDVATRRRLHPATMWGGAFLVGSQTLRVSLMHTHAWLVVARWIVS